MTIHVDLGSFKKGFPAGMPIPARLTAFAKWIAKVPFGGLGTIEALASEPLDVTYTDNQAATTELRESLGVFLPLGEGSRLALWKHGDGEPAVVLLGSEGALENVAPDLDTFLHSLAKQSTGINELDDDDDEVDSSRPGLVTWLKQQGAKVSKKDAPEFKAWFHSVVDRHKPVTKRSKEAAASSKQLAKAPRVKVDLPSVMKDVPAGYPLPPRLEAFAKWLAKAPDGGLCEMEVEIRGFLHSIANDDLVDAELRKHFVFFLNVNDIVNGENTRFALWNHGGADSPAVVTHDSKDRLKTLAPDLDSFLLAWTRGKTGNTDLDRKGDPGTRAELAAWLAKQGAKPSDAAAPDIAKWLDKVKADARGRRKPPKKLAAPGKPPPDMAERAAALLGRSKDDLAVIAFCNELGIDIEVTTDDSVLNRLFVPNHGYSMTFPVPEEGSSKPRIFKSIRFHRAKHKWWSYAIGRDVSFQEFKAPLPRGITFTSSRDQLKALLGKPTKDDDGDLRWTDRKTKVTLGVDFASQWDNIPQGEIKSVWLGD